MGLKLSVRITVGGNLTDADYAPVIDQVKRLDTDEVVLTNVTMTRQSLGWYIYDLDPYIAGIQYQMTGHTHIQGVPFEFTKNVSSYSQLDLTNLIPWLRRLAGDQIVARREVYTSDGTTELELGIGSNNYNVLTSVTEDGVAVDTDDVSIDTTILIFASSATPADGSRIVVKYNTARYSDTEILGTLVDAAREVGADLGILWLVLESGMLLGIPDTATADVYGDIQIDPMIQQLIVEKGNLRVREDKSGKADEDAILVKDGDTTIDTSKTAAAAGRSLKLLHDAYDRRMADTRIRRFRGAFNYGVEVA